ncbi:MAG: hypothetical protein PVG38_07150 [Gammaproteobacteria bacterium]|jgi:hypothetical protein
MLEGKELPEDLEEMSVDQLGGLFANGGHSRGPADKARGERAAQLPGSAMSSAASAATPYAGLLRSPEPIEYNPAIPIETFDIIVTEECHRSIYNLWAQVLEYFGAYLIGLTVTPSKQTFGFVHQNLVREYNHQMATFERIAKEGGKYGVSIVVVSQRPSDVSRTILSQCNNFLVLRLNNDTDQAVVRRLMPDSMVGLTDMLPLLDTGEALLLGDAVLIPTPIRLDQPSVRPTSGTREFWKEWASIPPDVGATEEAVETLRRQTRPDL